MFQTFFNFFRRDKIFGGVPRSREWPKVRSIHLKNNPFCAVCGGVKSLEVHHVKPYHLFPAMELNPGNLISLCESGKRGVTCHLFFGHLGNYSNTNLTVREDAIYWNKKLKMVF